MNKSTNIDNFVWIFSLIRQYSYRLPAIPPDEFQEKALGWDVDHHLQVASGNYRVSMDLTHTQNIQLSNVTHHIGIYERGAILHGTYAVSLPFILGTDPLYCCGRRLEKDECPALLPGEEFETHSSGTSSRQYRQLFNELPRATIKRNRE